VLASFSLVGSKVALAALATLVKNVPAAVLASMRATSVNTTGVGDAVSSSDVQRTLPPLPTAGVVQVQAGGVTSDTKVMPAGSASSKTTLAAGSGPRFVIDTLNVTSAPGCAWAGDVFSTSRSL
jgi:hypothetical protein